MPKRDALGMSASMSSQTPARRERNAAQREFEKAGSEHRATLNKHSPDSTLAPGETLRVETIAGLSAFDEIVAAIEHLGEAQIRLDRAVRALQREEGLAG